MTNRLRTEGTEHLLAAARAAGVERVVVQSYAGWPYARTGGPVKTEDDPLDPDPPAQMRATLDAIRRQEALVTEGGGVVAALRRLLRAGHRARARRRAVGEVRTRASSRSSATAAACGRSSTSRTPRPRRSPRSSTGRRARSTTSSTTSPRRCASGCPRSPPRSAHRRRGTSRAGSARLMGEHVVAMMCEVRGASNAKARRELGWTPRWPTWREGFAALGATRAPARAAS